MSYTNINNVKIIDKSLVEKILEQGQKLRNAMVDSILRNDPFNTEVIYDKHFNTPRTTGSDINDLKKVETPTSLDEKRLEAFINGEYLTKEEQKLALDTLRSLSAPDLCKAAEKSLNSARVSSCKCYTCESYNSNNLYCDLKRKNITRNVDYTNCYPANGVTRDIQEKYRNNNRNFLKYVDSLRVSISSLILNETGNQKVSSLVGKKVPYDPNQSFFLEYIVPDSLVNKSVVSKSKVNSGLENNYVRLCSRRTNDLINFKQVTIHDVRNLDEINLDEVEIKFKISYRTAKQKNAGTLGFANFNLGSFLLSKYLTCSRGLSIFLNENSPIVVGTLKISLQLGCGRLYFGKEFIDAITTTKRNSVILDSDDSASQLNNEKPNFENDGIPKETYQSNYKHDSSHERNDNLDNIRLKSTEISNTRDNVQEHVDSSDKSSNYLPLGSIKRGSYFGTKREYFHRSGSAENKALKQSELKHFLQKDQVNSNKSTKQQIDEIEKQILFGFLYISEARYLSKPINTYITCRPFCQNETSCSKLIAATSNPIFNFHQLIPLIFEDDLLHLLRENYMVIEFWEKTDSTEFVIGLTKIGLHQFYLAYRNPVILKYLCKNQLPIIGTDWWEPIYTINKEEVLGQVQVLIALGTEEQINKLKSDRGFTSHTVKAKFQCPKSPQPKYASKNITTRLSYPRKSTGNKCEHVSDFVANSECHDKPGISSFTNKSIYYNSREQESTFGYQERSKFIDQAVNTSISTREISVGTEQKFDVSTQSDLDMDKKIEKEEKANPTQEMLGTFLNQLMSQRPRNVSVENSTNTETVLPETDGHHSLRDAQTNTNVELRKTTDLLDSLQKALSLGGAENLASSVKKADMFKANILIRSANHLPSRKKCKSKKSRNRSLKNDENVLPSCYVTFETLPDTELKVTQVVSKSTSPVWNYKCDVNLPINLLTNSQKRLIFKVWRKATNAVMLPNTQTDVVLGFAAVDLTVLLAGFPNVQGWFSIIDFSGKCNGEINIHITPLENLSKYIPQKEECNCNIPTHKAEKEPPIPEPENEPSEMLSRALKRKFTELDEITQRLRLRLSKVTNEDSDGSSDSAAEEFERDINTLCIEEDFDLINFEEEAKKFNINHNKDNAESSSSSEVNLHTLLTIQEKEGNQKEQLMQIVDDKRSNTTDSASEGSAHSLTVDVSCKGKEKELVNLDKHLQAGKQRIDTLLEKLSLLSADNPFTSRYVSGCSLSNDNTSNIDTEAILKELDHSSRPNIQSTSGFDALTFQQLYGGSVYSNSQKESVNTSQPSNSDTSLITNVSEYRPAPDGQGNT